MSSQLFKFSKGIHLALEVQKEKASTLLQVVHCPVVVGQHRLPFLHNVPKVAPSWLRGLPMPCGSSAGLGWICLCLAPESPDLSPGHPCSPFTASILSQTHNAVIHKLVEEKKINKKGIKDKYMGNLVGRDFLCYCKLMLCTILSKIVKIVN